MGEEAETAGWPGVSTIHLGKPEIPLKNQIVRAMRVWEFLENRIAPIWGDEILELFNFL